MEGKPLLQHLPKDYVKQVHPRKLYKLHEFLREGKFVQKAHTHGSI